jgi:hypothetical protein
VSLRGDFEIRTVLIAIRISPAETAPWRDSCVSTMSPIHLKTGQKIIK